MSDPGGDQRRQDSVYGQEGVVPERLVRDLGNAEVLTEMQINAADGRGLHRGTLTAHEREIVLHLSHGLAPRMIAQTLGKQPDTINKQIKSARAALNAKTRTHLVAIALRSGLID